MIRACELSDADPLYKTLLKLIPRESILVDQDGWLMVVSDALGRMLVDSGPALCGGRGRESLECIRALESATRCANCDNSSQCVVRRLAFDALVHNKASSCETSMRLAVGGEDNNLRLEISATPLEISGRRLALVVIEDMTGACADVPESRVNVGGMVGCHPVMLSIFDMIRDVAPINVPVLIQGETGTGKELVAAAIHAESRRRDRNFVPVNCAALPQGLLESELFGHVKGAFTGAISDKKGRFELADGGTIFLDEIGEMSPDLQAKLLRVLQEGSFERVGSTRTIHVDVRVVSATNKNLEKEVAEGRFRRDLYYRLCVVPITLPPLRERAEDVPLLARHFIAQTAEQLGRRKPCLSQGALSILVQHDWPGNVRELRNSIHFSLIRCRGDTILPEHLPPSVIRCVQNLFKTCRSCKLEMQTVISALEKAEGNKTKAAKLLGVSRSTLYRFMESQVERDKGARITMGSKDSGGVEISQPKDMPDELLP